MFFPALANFALERMKLWPRNNTLAKLLELTLCGISLTLALPMSIALFNQRSKIDRSKLEAEFQNIKDPKTGDLMTHFYFNKGL